MNIHEEFRRFKRLAFFVGMIFILGLVVAVVFCSVQLKHLNTSIASVDLRRPLVIRGIDGKDGLNGVNGLSIVGTSGLPGEGVTSQQIAEAVSAYLQANPVMGVQGVSGTPGQDGKTLQLQVNPDTCVLQEKYVDDDTWTFVAQLPTPCAPNYTSQ